MAKADIRKCRFCACKHPNKEIDLTKDKYIKIKSYFYHQDCYRAKLDQSWKNEKEKTDLQLIHWLWLNNINKSVSHGELFRQLNDLLSQGNSSEYLVFAMKYVISHHMKLNYPAGFKYYVNRAEIKNAYDKHNAEKVKTMNFTAVDKDDAPKFSVNKKQSGFQSILGNQE